ncbi:hypothetical protein HDV00_004092 [Rhizophlyctis rosea]|nr:hypothetical protein HDV00_004092 [Rhizophlyctis rosea]
MNPDEVQQEEQRRAIDVQRHKENFERLKIKHRREHRKVEVIKNDQYVGSPDWENAARAFLRVHRVLLQEVDWLERAGVEAKVPCYVSTIRSGATAGGHERAAASERVGRNAKLPEPDGASNLQEHQEPSRDAETAAIVNETSKEKSTTSLPSTQTEVQKLQMENKFLTIELTNLKQQAAEQKKEATSEKHHLETQSMETVIKGMQGDVERSGKEVEGLREALERGGLEYAKEVEELQAVLERGEKKDAKEVERLEAALERSEKEYAKELQGLRAALSKSEKQKEEMKTEAVHEQHPGSAVQLAQMLKEIDDVIGRFFGGTCAEGELESVREAFKCKHLVQRWAGGGMM